MGMRLDKVIGVLEGLAPLGLAEPWDKVGLHVGDLAAGVRRALLCIDLTEAVLREAVSVKTDLVVAYHPPIFEPLTSVTTEQVKSRIIYEAVRAGIAVYSPHTALDAANGGVNDWLAAGLGKGQVRPIRPVSVDMPCKLVVFVPVDSVGRVREALASAGAGMIGNYSQCSFAGEGEGTFIGAKNTRPVIGKAGQLERVNEQRLEMVCPRDCVGAVIETLGEVHPYEQPAYDLYPMLKSAGQGASTEHGQGRVVTLDKAVSLNELVRRVKKRLRVRHVDLAKAKAGQVRTIGVCAGAGGSLLDESGEIDVFFTGEMRHHDVLAAVAQGVSVILTGHTQTERPYLKTYRRRIIAAGGEGVDWMISKADKAPSGIV